jgi:cell division protein FtsI (penicillin-binding protein 3)
MLGRTDSRSRALLLLVAFVLVAGSLLLRLGYWQVVRRDDLSAMARQQTSLRYEEPSRRGSVYDRTGTVVLATTVYRDRLTAAPKVLSPGRRAEVAATLVDVLGLRGAPAAALTERMTSNREYVILARGLEPEVSDRIRELSRGSKPKLGALSLEPEPVRIYPHAGGGPDSTLASHLIGFVNREGGGQYGIEQRYQAELAGSPRVMVAQRDVNSRPIPETAAILEPGTPGEDVLLTIDAGLQLAVEQELLAAWIADRAKRVSAVVMDPYTGEIYAYASYPGYDANDFRQVASEDPGRFVDPIISTVYEPGSVFKLMTAAAALEAGTVTLGTKIKDAGSLKLDKGRARVDNADRKSMGLMTFQTAMAYSRNVIAAKVALDLGSNTREAAVSLHAMWRRLGFGQVTGVDLAGEVSGLVRDPAIRTWRQIDVANASFGQGVAVTPLQLAQAYAVMVNGGTLVQPRVVRTVGPRDTARVSHGRIIEPEISDQLQAIMRAVVDEVPFYRDRTLIPGYEVGGKTGTAQIWDPELNGGKGAWKQNLFNYSFAGFVGREAGRPDLVVAVRIEEGRPTTIRVGHLEMPVMSFELFRRIAHTAITTPDLLPERPWETTFTGER